MGKQNKRQRRANFITDETNALTEIIEQRQDFRNGIYIGDQKDLVETWKKITKKLNDRKLGQMSTPQQVKDKWMRMMKDKKDVQNEAVTGGDPTSESASAESDDSVEGQENDSSSEEMLEGGMSVVEESPGPGTNPDVLATSQAPAKRSGSSTCSDTCSSQNLLGKEEPEKTNEELSHEKNELEVEKLKLEIEKLKLEIRKLNLEIKESKNGEE